MSHAAIGVICREDVCVFKLKHLFEDSTEVVTRFVVRGRHDSYVPPVLNVKVKETLSNTTAPFFSTWKWFKHALGHYKTDFIGHSEDDVYHNITLFAPVLNVVHSNLNGNVAVGALEIFHWCTTNHGSHHFWSHYDHTRVWNCDIKRAAGNYKGLLQWHSNNTRGDIIGPFPMMKGPLYFLSRQVVRSIIDSVWVTQEFDNIMRKHDGPPWDDVFVGAALAMSGIQKLRFVDTGSFFSQGCTAFRRPIYHKPCSILPNVSTHGAKLHCQAKLVSKSCSNTRWSSCHV